MVTQKTHVARHCRKHNRLRLNRWRTVSHCRPLSGQVAVNLTDSPAGQAIYGQLETFSVQVTAGRKSLPHTDPGIVDFMDGTIDLGNRRPNKSGNAVFNTRALDAGIHDLTAVYSGNSQFVIATSSEVTDTVSPAPTLTTLDGLQAGPATGRIPLS